MANDVILKIGNISVVQCKFTLELSSRMRRGKFDPCCIKPYSYVHFSPVEMKLENINKTCVSHPELSYIATAVNGNSVHFNGIRLLTLLNTTAHELLSKQ